MRPKERSDQGTHSNLLVVFYQHLKFVHGIFGLRSLNDPGTERWGTYTAEGIGQDLEEERAGDVSSRGKTKEHDLVDTSVLSNFSPG